MLKDTLSHILADVASGQLPVSAALHRIEALQGLENSRRTLAGLFTDWNRKQRCGLAEVVFAEGKSPALLLRAMQDLYNNGPVLASRLDAAQLALLRTNFPQGLCWPEARLFALHAPERMRQACAAHMQAAEKQSDSSQAPRRIADAPARADTDTTTQGQVVVISAGSADRPVAMEALGCLLFWDCPTLCIEDVGIAGMHRLLPYLDLLRQAEVVIAVAGMEGALPALVASLTPAPVLAVPTSVGYGVGAGGRAALNAMLSSCVAGMAVLNIDNGYGAAAFATKVVGQRKLHNTTAQQARS